MKILGAIHTTNVGSKNNQQHYFTSLIIYVKAKLIKLSEWLSLVGASL
jgi:hypothetical protein